MPPNILRRTTAMKHLLSGILTWECMARRKTPQLINKVSFNSIGGGQHLKSCRHWIIVYDSQISTTMLWEFYSMTNKSQHPYCHENFTQTRLQENVKRVVVFQSNRYKDLYLRRNQVTRLLMNANIIFWVFLFVFWYCHWICMALS